MSESIDNYRDPESLVLRYLENPREDLKDLIMMEYAGTVERVARRFNGIEPFEDLCQVGFIGLLNALSRFDPNAGVRFNTYATYLVAGEIKHYLRDRAQHIRRPAWLQELSQKVNKTTNLLQVELGRPPTDREVSEQLGVSESAVSEVHRTQTLLNVVSYSTPANENEDGGEEDSFEGPSDSQDQLSLEDRLVLESAFDQLRELERKVLVLFHFQSVSQNEIASRLGISCNYVSHILRQSLSKLRKILSNEEARDRLLRREADDVNYEIVDGLTGAYTEQYFRNRLQEETHRAGCEGSCVGLLLANFTGLEAMRKFYGEQSVNDFMVDAAAFFKENVRRLDVVGRMGDTGFGIILPSTNPNIAAAHSRLMTRIQDWLTGRYGTTGSVTMEVGFASIPANGKTAADLLAEAVPKAQMLVLEEAA